MSKEERAYGWIAEALSGGLYPNRFHVIREYVQNSFDAIQKFKKSYISKEILKIDIQIKKPSIFIFDNGTGMDKKTLSEFKNVGFSRKKSSEDVGFRGIGKLAGVAVASKLIITTSMYGSGEKHTLIWDAESMNKHLERLKRLGGNISLSDLIEKHTQIKSDKEEKNRHYTLIELQSIRNDSNILFDKNKLKDYLSKTTPVPFDPTFKYSIRIEEMIRQSVDNYDTANVLLDGEKIVKPYTKDMNVKTPRDVEIKTKNNKRVIAYCWYCENKNKGQIKPKDLSGLFLKIRNFSIGDTSLSRNMLWDKSPHLSNYFIGEIHIISPQITPTAQRDSFKPSKMSTTFVDQAKLTLPKRLNDIARYSSDKRRAIDFLMMGKQTIESIEKDIENKESYLKDVSTEKIVEVFNAVAEIEFREDNLQGKNKSLAKNVITKGNTVVEKLKQITPTEEYVDGLKNDMRPEELYKIFIETLKEYFRRNPKIVEDIIKRLRQKLKVEK
jgi:molecular chaperone HtpG